MLHVHAAYLCMLYDNAAYPWFMSLLHVLAACQCRMSMLLLHVHVRATCTCCISMLFVRAACPCQCCVPMLHAVAACQCCMSMLHVMTMLRVTSMQHVSEMETCIYILNAPSAFPCWLTMMLVNAAGPVHFCDTCWNLYNFNHTFMYIRIQLFLMLTSLAISHYEKEHYYKILQIIFGFAFRKEWVLDP
jgi:hypothetical protein